MDDFASTPRPVSARSPCLPCVFTSPKTHGKQGDLALTGRGVDALLAMRLHESEGDVPRRPHVAAILRRQMQGAERAGGDGHRLPAHHMRAAALSGPVE